MSQPCQAGRRAHSGFWQPYYQRETITRRRQAKGGKQPMTKPAKSGTMRVAPFSSLVIREMTPKAFGVDWSLGFRHSTFPQEDGFLIDLIGKDY
jgi:hypothetical protein